MPINNNTIPQIHHDLPVGFKANLKKKFLYDLNPTYEGQFVGCEVFALSSYKDHRLTFKVLLEDGGLFDYIPVDAILPKNNIKITGVELSQKELYYNKCCKDWFITVSRHSILKDAKPWCWFPDKKIWLKAVQYYCTIDWYTDNQNCHLVLMENNQFAFVPNHKMLLVDKQPDKLPDYLPIRNEWI